MRSYSDERRHAERVPTEGLGALCRFDGRLVPAAVVDISASGVRLASCKGQQMGTETSVTITTGSRGSIHVQGAVVYHDPKGGQMGIAFGAMDTPSRDLLDHLVSDLHIGQRYIPGRV